MAEILEFPFDSGAYEAADRKWLPPQMLAVAENVRLDRDGRLVVRPGATDLGLETQSSTDLTPYDLGNYQTRLVALGTQRFAQTGIQELFEYVESASSWRGSSGADDKAGVSIRIPTLTDIREVGGVPSQAGFIRHCSMAAGGGYVCACIAREDSSTIHVFDPTTNQTLLLVDVAFRLARVVYAGTTFWIYGVDADEDIVRAHFDPASDVNLTGNDVDVLLSNAAAVVDLAACNFGTGSAVAWCTASSAEIRTYTSSGTSDDNWQGVAAGCDSVALAGNAAGTLLTLVYQDTSSEYWATTFNASGTLQDGPTDVFGGAGGSGTRLGAAMETASTVRIVGVNELNSQGLTVRLTQDGHSLTTVTTYHDARPQMAPISVNNEPFIGWVDLTATNAELGTFHVTGNLMLPQCFLAQLQMDAQSTGQNSVGNGCTTGTKVYLPLVQLNENTGVSTGNLRVTIVEAECSRTSRRQMAEVAGELLVAGGLPLTYDGRSMAEIGFPECPIVQFSAELDTGSLEQLGVYQAKAVWKFYNGKNLVARSQPSPPASHTLTGSNDRITWRVTTPHALKRHPTFLDQNLTVVVELYRTVAGGGNFQLDAVVAIDPADDSAEFVTLDSRFSDSALADNAVLYSDESGLEISAPEPCRYVWPSRDRALLGGLPSTDAWQFSDLTIAGRQAAFALSRAAYVGRANQPITAVAAFETVGVVWTKDEIYQIPGRGPERSGTGEFDTPIRVPSPGGCIDWRSVVSTPEGIFFQMADDKLMLLTRSQQGAGAGSVVWLGQPVRETLAAFPRITAAVHVRSQMSVAFSCNNAAGTDGRILIYDLRRQQWFVDDVGGPVDALAQLGGRLVWLSDGKVHQQNAANGSGTFIPYSVQTGFIRVSKNLGWGHVYRVGLLGRAKGVCSVKASIDFDDGTGLRNLGTETVAGTEGTFERFWSLPLHKCSRFSVRFDVTSASSNSAGVELNAWAVEVEGSKNMVRVGSTGQVA